jgi:hypothetical protein
MKGGDGQGRQHTYRRCGSVPPRPVALPTAHSAPDCPSTCSSQSAKQPTPRGPQSMNRACAPKTAWHRQLHSSGVRGGRNRTDVCEDLKARLLPRKAEVRHHRDPLRGNVLLRDRLDKASVFSPAHTRQLRHAKVREAEARKGRTTHTSPTFGATSES